MHAPQARVRALWRVVAAACLALAAVLSPLAPLRPVPVATATGPTTLLLAGTGHLNVANAPALNPSGGLTIEAWFFRTTTNCESIVGKNFGNGYWLGICGSGTGHLRFYAGTGIAYDTLITVGTGDWHHAAVTYDGCTVRFYYDGMLTPSNQPLPCAPSAPPVNTSPLQIGADGSGNFRFSGSLADVRLWSTARSQADIRRDMVRLIDAPRPNLVANWHLEGNASDVFGSHSGTPVGTVSFTGPAAPPAVHDPIQIPRVAGAPTLDGNCGPAEYGNLRLPFWYADTFGSTNLAWVYVGATAANVYACVTNALVEIEDPVAYVSQYLDPGGEGGTLAQPTDYRISVNQNGVVTTERGDGAGGYTATGSLAGAAGAGNGNTEFSWAGPEFRFARSNLPAAGAIFRMQFMHHAVSTPSDGYGWPVNFDWITPDAWPRFQINDSVIPPSDSANPTVDASHVPASNIGPSSPMTISVSARDDRDLAQIDIFVDGLSRQTCLFAGAANTTGTCSYSQSYSLGRHSYYARAVDHRGRLAFTPLTSFFVQIDGRAPAVSVTHTPNSPAPGATVTIAASATDPSGIASLGISVGPGVAPAGRACTFSPAQNTATCTLTFTADASQRIVYYSASAHDAEGLTGHTGTAPVVFGNTGTDTDGDGLVDSIEALLCTSPSNPDTDHDALRDDWEVLGLNFPDGDSVNLPALGANPCRKDVFVQYDYERGAHAEPNVWPYIINLYRENGISLHLTEFERPRTGITSTVGAETAAATLDPSGRYYFHPKLAWTHHYLYSRHNPGNSGAWHNVTIDLNTNNCPLSVADPQNDPACTVFTGSDGRLYLVRSASDQIYRIVHELAHNLGLGHGGRTGSNARTQLGSIVYYEGGWDNGNMKPNYISAMNYGYNVGRLCFRQATNEWIQTTSLSDEHLGTLDENSLAEASSSFAGSVAALGCGDAEPDFVPVFYYGCSDSAGTRWVMTSDGTRARARLRAGSAWQTTDLPNPGVGIDWNCNGAIGATVSANINGDGAHQGWGNWLNAGSVGDVMNSNNDWANIPYGPGSACWILRDASSTGVFPADYLARMGRSDCQISSATGPGVLAEALAPASQEAAVWDVVNHQDPYDASEPKLPNLEVCDGYNNDGDLAVDEGCRDGDEDGTADAIDNCPQTANATQTDANGNGLGDACERPAITSATFDRSGGNANLAWQADTADVAGFNVYRRCTGQTTPAYLGSAYPTTTALAFSDLGQGAAACLYMLRPVNLLGIETDPYQVGTFTLNLPTMMRR